MDHALAQDTSLWRALLSSKVGLVFVVTFFCVSFSLASAQSQDVTPPTLTAFSLTPTTIDTSAGPAVVTASFAATDDLSGVNRIVAEFRSPSGMQVSFAVPGFPAASTSVSVSADASFPQFSETGTWTVSLILVADLVGNSYTYSTTEIAHLGFPTTLVVVGQADDVTPPTLTAFSLTPTTIDTSAGPAVVTASFAATDDLSGVNRIVAEFRSPSGMQVSFAVPGFPAASTSVSVSADASFPQFSETGTWTVSLILVADLVGNSYTYSTTEIAHLGFPTTLVVVGQADDVTPPTLTAFSLTPTTIDTSAGPAVVTASFAATDDLSGVNRIVAEFRSPSGMQVSFAVPGFPAASTSVSVSADASFPQFSETGTWTVSLILVADLVGNSYTYSTTEIAHLGFPTTLVVVGQADDVTPPVISVSATPPTLWPPNGRMVPVTISGTIKDAESGVNASTTAYAVIDEYRLIQPSGRVPLGSDGSSYSFTILLQASRNGNDQDGRQYIIIVSAQDDVGNQGVKSTVVTVPRN